MNKNKILLLTLIGLFMSLNVNAQVALPGNIKTYPTPANKTTIYTDAYGNQQAVTSVTPNVSIITNPEIGNAISTTTNDLNQVSPELEQNLDLPENLIAPVSEAEKPLDSSALPKALREKVKQNSEDMPTTKKEEVQTPLQAPKKAGQIKINNTVIKTNDIRILNTTSIEEIELKAKKDLEEKYQLFLNN